MGFLRPKMPPPPPPPPPMPTLPPATPDRFTEEQRKKVNALVESKKKGYTDTILTSTKGDTSEADIYKKTLLGA
ncbi:MAG: hypothetical protein Unbinned2350contig1001_16 [Prokaryotic dsDNA virus sp.]|jgi:hypothetical protein|nr:MAG: hypothetical protein Unbinned2350contig1001_16 [Prokaryotic dsDNA virus sp.]|tara:strand:- start:19609 stop:19830 length:222 start_codon:yes stop_codon:yes gene_type:complete